MRFSLKWLLAGTVYAALAAAAFAQAHWVYADILWAATFLASVYAIIVAIFARGSRQLAGAGFAIASLLLVGCLHFAPNSVPTGRIIVAMADGQPPPAPRNVNALYGVTMQAQMGVFNAQQLLRNRGMSAPLLNYMEQEKWLSRYRTANAVATMAAGLTGCALGVVAYRRKRTEGN